MEKYLQHALKIFSRADELLACIYTHPGLAIHVYVYPRAYIRIHRYIVDRRLFIPLLSLISSASRARFFTATPFLPLEYAYVYTLYTHTSTIIPLCIYISYRRGMRISAKVKSCFAPHPLTPFVSSSRAFVEECTYCVRRRHRRCIHERRGQKLLPHART